MPQMHLARLATSLGEMLLEASETALVGVFFMDQKHFPRLDETLVRSAPLVDADKQSAHPLLRRTAEELTAYLSGSLRRFTLPVEPQGTDFQRRVWSFLQTIPYGEVRSYGDVAAALGVPKASRAVGAAVGRNPITVIIPCHRVIGKNGSLTGYAGGLVRKSSLLDLELRMTE